VIIDRGVQEAMTNPGPVLLAGLPAEGAVPTTIWDAAEFLHVHVHVHVHQLAGSSTDPALVSALHAWFDGQVADHSMPVMGG
jgi:hypothetical protein